MPGLPADKLSASIVSIARFFSLPLNPGLLAKIRQQALMPQADQTAGKDGPNLRGREALVLAAAAAADKGVELNRKGLAEYAAAMDPEAGRAEPARQGEAGQTKPAGDSIDADGQQNDGGQNAAGKDAEDQGGGEKARDRIFAGTGIPGGTGPGLKDALLGAAEDNPLLDLLNRLPGKNGQRWIVLPLNFSEDGESYRLSLRILLNRENQAERMALEIIRLARAAGVEKARLAEQRWLFMLDGPGGRDAAPGKLELLLQPAQSKWARAALARDLKKWMKLSENSVFIRNMGEISSFMADIQNDLLLSINEEV